MLADKKCVQPALSSMNSLYLRTNSPRCDMGIVRIFTLDLKIRNLRQKGILLVIIGLTYSKFVTTSNTDIFCRSRAIKSKISIKARFLPSTFYCISNGKKYRGCQKQGRFTNSLSNVMVNISCSKIK